MPGPNDTTILLTVDIQANNARLVELTKQLNANKEAQQALVKANQQGRISADELAAGQVRLKQQATDLTNETRVLTKANADQEKANKSAAGSINQLRAELSRGTAAYNALSEAERDNTEAGQALQAANRALSDRLKELEGAVGDTRRNVGNYKDSLKDAIKESGFFGGITAKVTEAQETFSKAQNIAKAAIGGNVTALGFLRLALLATGLGALVVVLGSVVAFLTKSQTGIDLVSRKFAGLKAVVDLVIGVASEFGETLFKALSNPKQAISDLIDFIETNLVNRVKAIGVIFQALADRDFRKANDGLIQLTIGVANASDKFDKFAASALSAAKAGEAIEAENQRILRSERALNVERSESRARIEELKKLSDDSTQSVATRTTAAKEAARIENGLLSEQLKLQDDKIKNALRSANLDKQQTNDELDAIAELRSARAETIQESLTLQTELQNSLNSLNTEAAAKEEARRKALDDAMLKSLLAEDEANKKREEDAGKFLDAEDKARIDKLAKDDQARAEGLEKDQQNYDSGVKMLERALDERRLKLETDLANGVVGKEEYENKLSIIEEGGYSARLLLAKQFHQDESAADKARTRFLNGEITKRTDKQRAEYQKLVDESTNFGQQIGSIFGQTLAETGATLEDFAQKALILILETLEKQVLAQQAAATAASLAQPDSVATFGATGLVRAGIINALIVAAFEATKAVIGSFATGGIPSEGGIIRGAGTGTSDSIVARVSNGESIINANSTQMFRPVLSFLNEIGGGKPFAGYARGGIPLQTGSADGGLMSRAIGGSAGIDYNQLAQALANHPTFVQVTDINNAQGRRAKVRATSTLGK